MKTVLDAPPAADQAEVTPVARLVTMLPDVIQLMRDVGPDAVRSLRITPERAAEVNSTIAKYEATSSDLWRALEATLPEVVAAEKLRYDDACQDRIAAALVASLPANLPETLAGLMAATFAAMSESQYHAQQAGKSLLRDAAARGMFLALTRRRAPADGESPSCEGDNPVLVAGAYTRDDVGRVLSKERGQRKRAAGTSGNGNGRLGNDIPKVREAIESFRGNGRQVFTLTEIKAAIDAMHGADAHKAFSVSATLSNNQQSLHVASVKNAAARGTWSLIV